MSKFANRIGAVFYCLWGLLHIAGGLAIMSAANPTDQIALQASARHISEFSSISGDAVIGVLNYHAYNLLWFGIFAIVVAIVLIWRNLHLGYWLNFLVIGAVEFGLVSFMLVPGNMKWADGSIGLGLFFAALFFSSIGVFTQARMIPSGSPKPQAGFL